MPPPPQRPQKKKTKAPTTASAEQLAQRQRGALLGLAVGEALGISNDQRRLPSAPFPELNVHPIDEPRGGGPLEFRAGQVSWRAELAGILAAHLRDTGHYEATEVGKAYARWLPHALEVPDAVKAALNYVREGYSSEYAGKLVWKEGFQRIHDGAPLARTAPIGVFLYSKRDERLSASFADCGTTHFDPLCRLACATLNGIIAAALVTPSERLSNAELITLAEAELSTAASTLGRVDPDWVAKTKLAADFLREDFEMARRDDPELFGPELHLFFPLPSSIRVSYRLALWELFHAPSFEAALLDVVNRGGSTATNAAVTGALLGAVFGENAVPELWSTRVLSAVGPSGGAHWNTYHPRLLISLTKAEIEPYF